MNEPVEARKTKERSPNFPFISLEMALGRARQFYEEEKRGSAPFQVAAEHWHYSSSSSGALQTAAALKSYGLMIDEGSGSARKLKLTELALRILLDNRPESEDRERFKRQAALTPNVAADVYEKWNGELPSDANLNHYLVLELGFKEATALRTSKILKANQEFTRSAPQDAQSVDNAYMEEATKQMVALAYPKQISTSSHIAGGSGVRVDPAAAAVTAEVVKDENNEDIVLKFTRPPTIESYEFLKDYIDLRIKALKRRAQSGGDEKAKEEASGQKTNG